MRNYKNRAEFEEEHFKSYSASYRERFIERAVDEDDKIEEWLNAPADYKYAKSKR